MRSSRTVLCCKGHYFERLRKIIKPRSADGLLYTIDGDNQITQRTMLYHWYKMIELADIADRKKINQKVHSFKLFGCMVEILTDWHSETLHKYIPLKSKCYSKRTKNVLFISLTNL